MVEAVWEHMLPRRHRDRRRPGRRHRRFARILLLLRAMAAMAVVALLGWIIVTEARTSFLQSRIFSHLARAMTFSVAAGPSDAIRFPTGGPYDERLGYAELPRFIEALGRDHFVITRQARWSPTLEHFVEDGGYAIYREKTQAGLQLFDRHDAILYRARYPQRAYPDFASIPPLVVASLTYIEDRDLLAPHDPRRNPAVDWDRFMLAVAGRIAGLVNHRFRAGGASTLATQTEKFLHSPGGRTRDISEKLRQMVTASTRAYLGGPDTMAARRHIVTTYLDTEPLGSRPGYGEIIGVPDALWHWYGTDLAEADRVLTGPATTPAALARKGEIYRQVLSLLLAGRRPSYYLDTDHAALAALTDRYLRLLSAGGVITPALRNAALTAPPAFRAPTPRPAPPPLIAGQATDQLRDALVERLHLANFYALDRLDLSGWSSIDSAAQQRIGDVLSQLGDPAYDRSLGLFGKQLLNAADPSRLAWSVVLYERGRDCNYVRIRADSLNEPFDINAGAKLQLGSTAKLRTLITYLDIVDTLHKKLAPLDRTQLLARAAAAKNDPITRWAAGYLADAHDRSLRGMLEAAMQRTYSASPATFFTGGGLQSFANFSKWENHERPTVAVAFANSINLAFVRLMRDIVDYYIAAGGPDTSRLLSDPDDPERMIYLWRFADREGQEYLDRFWHDYHGRTPQQALDLLASRTLPVPRRLAVVFRTVRPDASKDALAAFLARRLPHAGLDDTELWDLYRQSSPSEVSLRDRGAISGVHPLELWLVAYLRRHPDATRVAMLRASERTRQEVYAWLFEPRSRHLQTLRIRTLLEQSAFDRILQDWRRQGYPFARLVPSLGTVLGSSGDRPDALASLLGIIVNDGVRLPTVDLEKLDFAVGTPYETDLAVAPQPRRVLDPAVAETVRQALLSVVASGTGTAVRGVYHRADGTPLPVGGKTGTGDNRSDHFGAGGRLISQQVVDRTATFAFFLGDRFFGTITAYVPGAVAARYDFTSALAVHLLKAIRPQLEPLLQAPQKPEQPAIAAMPKPVAGVGPAPD
ncbi:MAG TPA: transglycosylase domain-containing protein [Stellaceae bacterium]|nr:transglycosylase domain-containing protein [Stellaceae bacterium]